MDLAPSPSRELRTGARERPWSALAWSCDGVSPCARRLSPSDRPRCQARSSAGPSRCSPTRGGTADRLSLPGTSCGSTCCPGGCPRTNQPLSAAALDAHGRRPRRSGSALFGEHPWHWYLTQGLPAVLGPMALLLPVGLAAMVAGRQGDALSDDGARRSARRAGAVGSFHARGCGCLASALLPAAHAPLSRVPQPAAGPPRTPRLRPPRATPPRTPSSRTRSSASCCPCCPGWRCPWRWARGRCPSARCAGRPKGRQGPQRCAGRDGSNGSAEGDVGVAQGSRSPHPRARSCVSPDGR